MKDATKTLLKKFWWVGLIPLIPIALNFLLPIANWSLIGGENSLTVWLSFWSSFSNSLIYCCVTFLVLYRQIKNDTRQNSLNRKSNERENQLNRQDNITQNEQNREINLKTIQYNTQLSQLSNIIPICAEYVSQFDLSDIKILKREWHSNIRTKEYCLNILSDRNNRAKNIFYRYLLCLQSCDNIDESFINNQKNHIHRFFELLSILKLYFCCDIYDFRSEEERVNIIDKLNKNDLGIVFLMGNDPYFQIEYEFSEIGLYSIQMEIEYFIANQKEKISKILYE